MSVIRVYCMKLWNNQYKYYVGKKEKATKISTLTHEFTHRQEQEWKELPTSSIRRCSESLLLNIFKDCPL